MSSPLYAGPGTRYTANYFPGAASYKPAVDQDAFLKTANPPSQELKLTTTVSEEFPLEYKKVGDAVVVQQAGMFSINTTLQIKGVNSKDCTPDAYIRLTRGGTASTLAQQWVRMVAGAVGGAWNGAITISYSGYLLAGDVIDVQVINKSNANDESIQILKESTLQVCKLG